MFCSVCIEYSAIVDSAHLIRYKGAWTEKAVSGWINGVKKLSKHDDSVAHKTAVEKMKAKKQTELKGTVVKFALFLFFYFCYFLKNSWLYCFQILQKNV